MSFLQLVRVARDRHDVCAMNQQIEERRSERCVAGQRLIPLAERQISDRYETARFVGFGAPARKAMWSSG